MAESLAAGLLGVTDNPLLLLLLLNLLLFFLGMFLDAGPAILILGPVFGPVFTELGVDPIHFAMIMCINLTVGLVTPPMGLVLFVTASISGERVERIVRALLPFLVVHILVIAAVTCFPALTLTLPRWLGLLQ
jgi:TRAP-type C4-dicarboxylate transport system permease large subunit